MLYVCDWLGCMPYGIFGVGRSAVRCMDRDGAM